jgi:PAS domain S-box-containing protein
MASQSSDGVAPGRSTPAARQAGPRQQNRVRRSTRTRKRPAPLDPSAQDSRENRRLRDVLERVSDALVALDRDWRCTYVNRRAAELFGRAPEELLGRHIWTEFPEGVGQPFQLAYEKAMAEQVFIQVENYYEPWDRWFENRIYPSPDGVSVFFHEITDRKRAERGARDSAALLEGQNRVLESIARGEPLERTLDMLLRFIEAQCPEMVCSILLPAAQGGRVRHGAAPSLPASFTQAMQGDASGASASAFAKAAFGSQAVIVEDIATSPLWDDCRGVALEQGFRACWSSPILDAHGRVLGAFAVYSRTAGRPSDRHRYLIDVATNTAATALVNRRETEARRVSDERLRMAVTGGNVGIWEWDVVTDRFVLSDQLRAMFNWPIHSGDLTLREVMEAIHREDRPLVEQALERSVKWGVDYDVEYRVVGPKGAVRWIATKGGGEYDETATPVRMMGVALDITTRKEAELQLRRSDERFQLVARATNDAIWDWDLETDAIWWNQGISTLFGYPADAVGRDAGWRAAHIHPEDLDAVVSSLVAVTARKEQFWSGEFRFRRADGGYADVFDRGFVTYDASGEPVRMIGAMADISERKRALEVLESAVASRTAQLHAKNGELEEEVGERKRVEQLLRNRNEELKAFAYTVSHDLKAPLRGIAGYAQELDRRHSDGLDDRGRLCIDRIMTAARNLDRLIEDLLRYSRLDAETPTPIGVDLAAMIESILRDRRPVILEQNADVRIALTVGRVHAWERGLMQVLTNLIDNALKYSRHATPSRVQVTSEPVAGTVRITVSDNGIGFDMKYHDRIFGLFNRLVRQEEFEGTGAGLAIVKKVVEKMGATVGAESSPGSGAAFFVDLPVGVPGDQ